MGRPAAGPRIALVQNQSEMAHYGYADARGTLGELGFGVELYTRENVGLLEVEIRNRAFDAILLASRALSDGVIAETFATERFRAELTAFLEAGRGLLCLHQLGVETGAEGSALGFLPTMLQPVATARKSGSAVEGTLAVAAGARAHPILAYPHPLDLRAVARRSKGSPSLPGLYWHGWMGMTSAWERIVVDAACDPPTPLLVASQVTSPHRVVLVAMPIDWQRNVQLLENALVYVATGWETTALLRLPRQETAEAVPDYLAATLRAWRYPCREYDLEQISTDDVQALARHLQHGLHRTLVLPPGADVDELPERLKPIVHRQVATGGLRVVSLGDRDAGQPAYSVFGREQGALGLLGAVELEIQRELHDGYVAGSFWATVEILQTLEELPQRSRDYRDICPSALAIAARHDSDGSYDEVLSATAALFWLRTYAGDAAAAERSLEWLRRALASRPSPRDGIYALALLCSTGVATSAEREALIAEVERFPIAEASEVDLLTILRAIRLADMALELPVVERLVEELIMRPNDDGMWLDVSTSAAIVVELLKLGRPAASACVQRAMIGIQRARSPVSEERMEGGAGLSYQWGRHPLTTIRCLQAWLLFDAQLSFAVDEVVENLRSRDRFLKTQSTTSSALRVLDELRSDNARLREEVQTLEGRIARTAELEREVESVRQQSGKIAMWRFGWAALALMLLYVLVFTVVGLFEIDGPPTFDALLEHAGREHAGLHAVVATLVVGLLAVDWRRRGRVADEAT